MAAFDEQIRDAVVAILAAMADIPDIELTAEQIDLNTDGLETAVAAVETALKTGSNLLTAIAGLHTDLSATLAGKLDTLHADLNTTIKGLIDGVEDKLDSLLSAIVAPYDTTAIIAGQLCDDANYHEVECPAASASKAALYQFRATVTTEPFILGISFDDGAHWSEDILVAAGCVEEVVGVFSATSFRYKKSSGDVTVQGKVFYEA